MTRLKSAAQFSLLTESTQLPRKLAQIRGDDSAFLRGPLRAGSTNTRNKISLVDLFSGSGGISLGVREAAIALGKGFEVSLAADFDSGALGVYTANLAPRHTIREPIEERLDGRFRSALTSSERKLRQIVGPLTALVGGPPCQGHSNLNNSTRREDPKNALYGTMARAAEVFEPEWVLIENVLGAVHDKSGVVQTTRSALEKIGYSTSLAVVEGTSVGVAQRRKRLILAGHRLKKIDLSSSIRALTLPVRDLQWAIGDLEQIESSELRDQPAKSSYDTVRRIDYLFDNNLYELPDEMRPACHRDKAHTYKSVYGRLRWDQPAQTITSGFYSMCMGRYVHPSQRRTLTAREAARLQFIPDWFDVSSIKNRTALATIIGNAVPPKLSYVAALAAMSTP